MTPHPMYDLSGRVALVTGGGGVIGGSSARALARAGADVVIVDLRDDDANSVAADIAALGRRALVLTGDASDYELADELSSRAVGEMGKVDILVNVAGGAQPKSFLELTPEEFDDTLYRNVRSAWNWAHCLAPGMLKRTGQRIVNIASISAKHGGGPPATRSKSAYAAAKAAVVGLTKGLAKELAPAINVNAVCPGLVETVGTSLIIHGSNRDAILATIPKGRVGTGNDIAAAVLFLSSPGAEWITGEIMDVNGGQYID